MIQINVEWLEHQIEALQTRIAALEAYQTFPSFMPNFSERFHVMHRAGESGDWAVAAHEFQEMKRLTLLSTTIDTEKGQLMQGMLGPSFEALESAIEHNDHGTPSDMGGLMSGTGAMMPAKPASE